MEENQEDNCKQRYIGDPLLMELYERLKKAEEDLEEMKEKKRLLERIIRYLETGEED